MSGAASNIVATLKSKIKETADELEKYEGVCEETRVRWRHTAATLLTLVTVLQCSLVMCISIFTILPSLRLAVSFQTIHNVKCLSLGLSDVCTAAIN